MVVYEKKIQIKSNLYIFLIKLTLIIIKIAPIIVLIIKIKLKIMKLFFSDQGGVEYVH